MDNLKFDVGDHIDTTGSAKRGSIITTYAKIIDVFGPPTHRMGDNTYNEWSIEFAVPDTSHLADEGDMEYTVAALYDWGAPSDPAKHPNDEYRFNIGGKGIDAQFYIYDLLGRS